MRHTRIVVLFLAIILMPLAGCNRTESGLSGEQEQMASRLDEISEKSGGDWEKVSQADRDYIIKDVSSGDENAAKRLLAGRSGKMRKGPPAQTPRRP